MTKETRCEALCTFAYNRKDEVLLLIRLTLIPIFIQTGLGKLAHFQVTVSFFSTLGIPFPAVNAAMASATELLGGILLTVGLGARLVALPLAFIMVIAIVTAKLGMVGGYSDFIRLQEWDYLVIFLLFATLGAGKWSLDHLFCKRKK